MYAINNICVYFVCMCVHECVAKLHAPCHTALSKHMFDGQELHTDEARVL
jgi:hypothetical protein